MAPNAPATASQISKGGGAAAQSAAVAASASGDIGAKDNAASSKRAHTDFRILGLEIKQLDWSWFAPSALAKAEDSSRDPTNEEPDSTQNPDEGAQEAKVAFAVAAVEDLSSKGHDAEAEASHAQGSARPDGRNDESNETKGENSAKDEHADTNIPDRGNAGEVAGIDASDAADAAADADDDGDVDADAVADADADADGDDDADAHAGDDEGDPKAEGEDAQDAGDNVSMSHADETAPSEHQHSVASTPEPSSERSKDPAAKDSGSAAQKGPKSKAEGAKLAANLRDSTKLRLCFAAMSNAGPEGAPTGPKSSKMQALKTETESNFQEETIAELTVPDPNTTEEAEAREPSTAETKADDVGLAQELTEIKSEPEQPLVQTREDNIALGSDDAEAPPANTSTELADATTAVTDANVKEKKKEDVEEGGAAEKNVAVKQEDDEQIDQIAAEHQDDETTSEADKNKKSRLTAEPSPPAKGPPQLSLNRIFLSFAANRKRLAIDAEAVKSVKIHRSEHWIEICIDASQQDDHAHRKKGGEYLVCRGSLLEKRTKGQENYTAVSRTDIAAAWDAANGDASDDDHLELPPFFRLPSSSPELVLHVRLDPSAPLPEPAWLRKNDVAELLANLQRGSSAIAGQSDTAVSVATAQHVWAGKIQVLDPDPPPSMSTFMYEWVKGSFIGSQKERRKFVDELLGKTAVKVEGTMVKVEEGADADNERDARVARSFVEIVLRLIKGERVTSTIDSSVFTAALASTSYTSSTTYPGLFMLGLLEVALAADPAQVREQVDRMLMAFPRATLVKAVDLTWKDVVESGRKGEAPIPAAAPAPARPAGSQRRQHQNGRQHHHGGGAQNRHGKRKRG
uniref:Uncharacterized protein n=2 Tax=Kalmanozyma brasiliensis (strain GHG001) TaxID=1365824 RepID=V5ECL7_KALBG